MKKRCCAILLAACMVLGLGAPEGRETITAAEITTEVATEISTENTTEETTEQIVATESIESTETIESVENTENTESVGNTESTENTENTEAVIPTVEEPVTEVPTEEMVTETEETEQEELSQLMFPSALPPAEIIDGGIIDTSEMYDVEEDANAGLYRSTVYNSAWDKYSTNYFYNQLSDAQRQAWENMDQMCRAYLTGTADIALDAYNNEYMTQYASCGAMDWTSAYELARLFRFSNPQYYFLTTLMGGASDGRGNMGVAFGVYPLFADGDTRKAETAKVQQKAEEWVAMAQTQGTDAEKVLSIHNTIVNNVDYNYDLVNSGLNNDSEKTAYSQSVYSVFCTDYTVCAGYAQTFEMLCNAIGIDTISVTSRGHQWNKVRIDDSWYNVDCTWADQGTSPVYYAYFEKSDAYYQNDNSTNVANHTVETYWQKYLPVCSRDSSAKGGNPGALPTTTAVTATPVITVTSTGSGNQVTMTCATAGATIYYSLNGEEPTPASNKSYKYTGAFTTSAVTQLQAVAVKDGCLDSAVTNKQVAGTKFKVVFNGNGSGSGSMAAQSFVYGTGTALTANAFKKTGYTFKNWNTKADGTGTAYANKADGSKITNVSGKTVTLYAQWVKTKYTITYNLNNGKNNSGNPAYYYMTSSTITFKNPTRTGYTFAGWYTTSTYKTKITQIKKGTTGNKTIYAKWTANKYSIAYNGNKNTSGKMTATSGCKYGGNYTLKTVAFKKTGYKFAGWNTKANGSGKTYANKEKVKNLTSRSGGTVTLYAQWTKVKYKITYNLNNGKNSKSNPANYYVTSSTIKFKNPSRTGYTFAGWYTDSKYKNKVTEIKKGTIGNKTLYAKWKVNIYTIAYNGNGSKSKSMASTIGCKYGSAYTLKSNAYKRTGYKFAGWNTKADGSGKAFANKASVKSLTSRNNGTVTLYAQWTRVK